MRSLRLSAVAVLLVAFFVPSARSEFSVGDGGVPANFLTLGLGARGLGMGGAQVAASNDAGALLANPAALARLYRGEFVAGDYLFPETGNYVFAGGVWPTIGYGTVALSLSQLTAGASIGRDAFNQPTEAQYTASHTGIVGGYALQAGPALLGASFLMVRQSLGTTSQMGITASLGAHLDLSRLAPAMRGASLGLKVGDIVPAKFGSAAAPLSLRPGAEYRVLDGALVLAADADVTTGRFLRYAAGVEYTYGGIASVRAGYNGSPTAGIGVRYSSIRADYAFGMVPLGLSHRVSVGLSFGPDLTFPRITVKEPAFNAGGQAQVGTNRVNLDVVVESRDSLRSVKLAGKAMKIVDRNRFALKQAVSLREGKNPLRIEADTDSGRRAESSLMILCDTQPPEIQVVEPTGRVRTSKEEIRVRLQAADPSDVMALSINDLPAVIQQGDRVDYDQPVPVRWAGRNVIRVAATDRFGHTRLKEIEVFRDGGPQQPTDQSAQNVSAMVNEQLGKRSVDDAKEYMRTGNYALAVAELKRAVGLLSNNAEAKTLLAQAEQQAARATPTSAPVTTSGGSDNGMGSMSEDVRKAMDAHLALGQQYFNGGQYKLAQAEFQFVVELNKQYRGAQELMIKAKEKLKEYMTTRLRGAQQAKADGKLTKEMTLLNQVLAQDDKDETALAMRAELAGQIPGEVQRLHLLALEKYVNNNLDDALKLWDEALTLDPNNQPLLRARDKARQKRTSELEGGK